MAVSQDTLKNTLRTIADVEELILSLDSSNETIRLSPDQCAMIDLTPTEMEFVNWQLDKLQIPHAESYTAVNGELRKTCYFPKEYGINKDGKQINCQELVDNFVADHRKRIFKELNEIEVTSNKYVNIKVSESTLALLDREYRGQFECKAKEIKNGYQIVVPQEQAQKAREAVLLAEYQLKRSPALEKMVLGEKNTQDEMYKKIFTSSKEFYVSSGNLENGDILHYNPKNESLERIERQNDKLIISESISKKSETFNEDALHMIKSIKLPVFLNGNELKENTASLYMSKVFEKQLGLEVTKDFQSELRDSLANKLLIEKISEEVTKALEQNPIQVKENMKDEKMLENYIKESAKELSETIKESPQYDKESPYYSNVLTELSRIERSDSKSIERMQQSVKEVINNYEEMTEELTVTKSLARESAELEIERRQLQKAKELETKALINERINGLNAQMDAMNRSKSLESMEVVTIEGKAGTPETPDNEMAIAQLDGHEDLVDVAVYDDYGNLEAYYDNGM